MGDAEDPRQNADLVAPVRTVNADGSGPFAIVVDHASNRIPPRWGDLGLPPSERIRHIAWDPGALAVALRLSELLDAPVVQSTISRLVIDCNRDIDAPDLVPTISEHTGIPGNVGLTDADRQWRIASAHTPFHSTIDRVLDARQAAGLETILICMHSFTPNIGWNEPYSALNGVTYTLEHHGDGRGLDATMIEIRHDEILEPSGVARWAERLARCLTAARVALGGTPSHNGAATGRVTGGLNG